MIHWYKICQQVLSSYCLCALGESPPFWMQFQPIRQATPPQTRAALMRCLSGWAGQWQRQHVLPRQDSRSIPRRGVDLLLSRTGAPWQHGLLLPDDSSKRFRLMWLDDAILKAETLMVGIILFLRFGFIGIVTMNNAAARSFDYYYHNSSIQNLLASIVFLLPECFMSISTALEALPIGGGGDSSANNYSVGALPYWIGWIVATPTRIPHAGIGVDAKTGSGFVVARNRCAMAMRSTSAKQFQQAFPIHVAGQHYHGGQGADGWYYYLSKIWVHWSWRHEKRSCIHLIVTIIICWYKICQQVLSSCCPHVLGVTPLPWMR